MELGWWGHPRPVLSPQGLRECVCERETESESLCMCALEGLRALVSDWVFREQRGVRKAPQWSNRISSLWWMVCESSTDSSLSQIHTTVNVHTRVCVCVRVCVYTYTLHPLVQGLFVSTLRAARAGMRKIVPDARRQQYLDVYVSGSSLGFDKSPPHGINNDWPAQSARTCSLLRKVMTYKKKNLLPLLSIFEMIKTPSW